MDIKWIILLMIVLYIVPELLKRRPKKYEYPEVPAPIPQAPMPAPVKTEPVYAEPKVAAIGHLKSYEGKPMSEIAPPIQPIDLEEPGWRGGLEQASVVNGVIFAEILQPPRAKRPLLTTHRR